MSPEPSRALSAGPDSPQWQRLSGLERVWLTASRINPPFAIVFVAEYPRRPSLQALRLAMASVARAHPRLNARLTGIGPWTRWRADGPAPEVSSLDAPGWDGLHHGGAEALLEPFDARRGPNVRLHLVGGADTAPCRLALSAPHSLVDGRGLLFVLEELCRALRGEPLRGSAMTLNDFEWARRLGGAQGSPPPAEALDRTSLWPRRQRGAGPWSPHWRRVRVERPVKRPLGPTLMALMGAARAAWADHEGDPALRVSVPVDLRRHRPESHIIGNLTGLVHLELNEWDELPGAPQAVIDHLMDEIERGAHLAPIHRAEALRWWPLWVMALLGGRAALQQQRGGLLPTSASVTNLGAIDRRRFALAEAPCEGVFMIPPGSASLPLFLSMSGDRSALELVGFSNEAFVSPEGLKGLMDRLAADLGAQTGAP